METKVGVWIDYKQAIVIRLRDAGQEVKKITFDIGQRIHSKGVARHEFVAENRLERKTASDRKDYFDDVVTAIGDTESLLILGPGEAKGDFSKHIKRNKLRGLSVEQETADQMTDRQLAAQVRAHFTTAGKKGSAKKSAVEEPAVSNAGSRVKKVGKKKSGE